MKKQMKNMVALLTLACIMLFAVGYTRSAKLVQVDGKWHYYDADGNEKTGFVEYNDNTYYITEDGEMKVGFWNNESDNEYYYADSKGVVQKNKFVDVDGRTYYLKADGKRQYGWAEIDGKTMFFSISKDDGHMVRKGWVYTIPPEGGKEHYYYFDEEGNMIRNEIKEINDKKYYFADDGKMKTGFVDFQGNTYYFEADGTMKTGSFKVKKTGRPSLDGKTFYTDEQGVVQNYPKEEDENEEEVLGEVLKSEKTEENINENTSANSTEEKKSELSTNTSSNNAKNIKDIEKAKEAYNLFIQYGQKAIKEFDNLDETTREVINQIEKYNLFDAIDYSLDKQISVEGDVINNLNFNVKNKDLLEKINTITSKGFYVITGDSEQLKVVDRDTAIGWVLDISKGDDKFIQKADNTTKSKLFLGTNIEIAYAVALALDEINLKNKALEAAAFVYKLPTNQVKKYNETNICKDSALRAFNSLNPYKEDGYELRGGVVAMTKKSQDYAASLSAKERDQFYTVERLVFMTNNPEANIIDLGGTNYKCKFDYPKYTFDWWSGMPLYFSRTKNEVAATIFGSTMYAWGVEINPADRNRLSRGNERSFITWFNREMTEQDEKQYLNGLERLRADCDLVFN